MFAGANMSLRYISLTFTSGRIYCPVYVDTLLSHIDPMHMPDSVREAELLARL